MSASEVPDERHQPVEVVDVGVEGWDVEDLGGDRARARVAFTVAPAVTLAAAS